MLLLRESHLTSYSALKAAALTIVGSRMIEYTENEYNVENTD